MADSMDISGIRVRRQTNGSVVLDHPSGHRDVYTREQVRVWLTEADRRIAEATADRAELASFITRIEALTATAVEAASSRLTSGKDAASTIEGI